jgi:amino acid adenylation domain-containing protein
MDLSQRIAKLSPEQRAQLDARLRKRNAAPMPRPDLIGKRPSSEPCLLSFAQERLWFLEQLEGASATYNIYSASRFRGFLRVQCLEQALNEIVCRHESLRTTFPVLDDNQTPIQQIAELSEFRLEVVDLSSKPEAQTESAVQQLVNEFARQPMYLAQGPLFRARLLHIGPDDHVLTVIMHHIISDGWTLDVFFRELYTLYADFLSGRKPSLPPLKIQFADFARWQRQHLQGEELKRHIEYWKERLAGESPILELPADFPRPAEQTYRGADCERQIGADLTENLRRMSRETEATMFMTVLAAFKALLHRYSGQPSIHVGSPVTSRNRIELEPIIGFFVNMLVLRTDFSGDPTVRELIRQVRQMTLEALAHQALPFEKLVRELQPERSLSHSPLFQAALMFEEAGHQFLQLPGLTSEPIPVNTATAKFDLTLFVNESPEGLRFGLEYATDLFTEETAERMLAHLECLLKSIVTDPTLRVSELNLLTPAEKQQLLVEWNQTEVEYPREKTIHALFEQQAQRTPDAIAIEFGRDRLTYRELDRRAEALAVELRQKGVAPDNRVGLYVERSLDMVVGVLGILKAGGAYVPLDPSFPKDRLTFMVSDAQSLVLVTQQRLIRELPEHKAQVVCVDLINHPESSFAPRPSGSAEGLAYVIYTSGSTGRPKGVQIPHHAVVNFLQSMRREPGLTAADVLLAITTLSFDIAGLELLLPLTTGAKVVVVPREIAMDGSELAGLLQASGATVMQATPATWRLLLAAGWQGSPTLKILCGGEPLPPDLAQDLLPRCAELWNMYGPTETTIWSTCTRVRKPDDVHIGRPIANTEIYILDPHLNPVPIGVPGELMIGGHGLARGYLNRPELTAEKFIPHPFKREARLYRTGDLAKYLPAGNIVCLGRLDFQVKIRGYRIELGEIEAVLSRHPQVVQAVVAVHDGGAGEPQLVAYLVQSDGANVAANDLRQHLRQELPDYMLPSVFVSMEELPLTSNGKVDRKALPPPSAEHVTPAASRVAPRNETESKLASIWAQVLGLDAVGVTDDFFALGGHSLLAVKLFAEIERQMHRKLPLASLFAAGTIEQLALQFGRVEPAAGNWSSLVAIQPKGTRTPLFCVHGAGGNVLLYRDLSANLGEDYPIYGFQSKGLDGRTQPLSTIEEMADHYLAELKSVRPNGPYCLAGYCLGGMVAYQMARLLRRAGKHVSFVGLFDSYNPARAGQASRTGVLWQRAKFHAGNLVKLGPRELKRYLVEKIRVAKDGELLNLLSSDKAPKASRSGKNAGGEAGGDFHNYIGLQQINDRAPELFQPQPYDGTVILFKPQVNYDFLSDPQMGWGKLVSGELNVVELPVNPHAMLVEPFVKHLAAALRQRLDQVEMPFQDSAIKASPLPS